MSRVVRNSMSNSTLDWSMTRAQWTDAHEARLITKLLEDVATTGNGGVNDQNLVNTLNEVRQWPNYSGRGDRNYQLTNQLGNNLSTSRNSFTLDTSDI
jgi:hypothetical protein